MMHTRYTRKKQILDAIGMVVLSTCMVAMFGLMFIMS